MSKKAITGALNIVELPNVVDKIEATFQYLYYEPEERTSFTNVFLNDDTDSSVPTGYPPRFVQIKIFKQDENPTFTEGLGNPDEFRGNIFNRITSEAINNPDEPVGFIQSKDGGNSFFTQDFMQGYVRILSEEVENLVEQRRQVVSTIEEGDILKYIKRNLSGSFYEGEKIDDYEDILRKNSSFDQDEGILLLDEDTLMPVNEVLADSNSLPTDSYVSSEQLQQILVKSSQSPLIRNITGRSLELANLISSQAKSNDSKRYFSNMNKSLFDMNLPHIEPLNSTSSHGGAPLWDTNKSVYRHGIGSSGTLEQLSDETYIWNWIGYQVIKYVKIEGNWIWKASWITRGNVNPKANDDGDIFETIKDPYVLYGQEYKYEIRDAWSYTQASFSLDYTDTEEVTQVDADGNVTTLGSYSPSFPYATFIILGTISRSINVSCIEKLPPPPPSNFSFDYIGDDYIKIGWTRQLRLWDETKFENVYAESLGESGPLEAPELNDIGGYLLFVRHSLEDPYEMIRQFHIQKKIVHVYDPSLPENKITTKEQDLTYLVPTDIIGIVMESANTERIQDKMVSEYNLQIRSNTDYYIAFASYDVHGNMSTYSEQFFIRKNNVTGEVQTKLICGAGSPLSYPNMLVPSKFVLSSMKASGYRCMNIYQTPDYSRSYPSNGQISIHLIDLETEADVVIEGKAGDSNYPLRS